MKANTAFLRTSVGTLRVCVSAAKQFSVKKNKFSSFSPFRLLLTDFCGRFLYKNLPFNDFSFSTIPFLSSSSAWITSIFSFEWEWDEKHWLTSQATFHLSNHPNDPSTCKVVASKNRLRKKKKREKREPKNSFRKWTEQVSVIILREPSWEYLLASHTPSGDGNKFES